MTTPELCIQFATFNTILYSQLHYVLGSYLVSSSSDDTHGGACGDWPGPAGGVPSHSMKAQAGVGIYCSWQRHSECKVTVTTSTELNIPEPLPQKIPGEPTSRQHPLRALLLVEGT